ncbi:NAD(P)/FAD-dependent oxidoreductase [Aestuariibius insulae]|uniref:NAD(P)/FAD-dependent oxidoreductase n=1 Tax=Aestuariibius insulae TaxID=2058287 RepID=UPI00345E37F4
MTRTLIIGAGAAGLMCAAHAGPDTLVIDHAKAAGEKIRISGGGRCNFTNMHTAPDNFLSQNPHFAKSALSRYTQWDFLDLVQAHQIAWHEKTLGQLFCDRSARDIIAMLLAEMEKADATLQLQTSALDIAKTETGFRVTLETHGKRRTITPQHIVLATGGKSIPKMGATDFAYRIARQFGHAVTQTRPALVPLTVEDRFKPLAGTAAPARVWTETCAPFEEAVLFTHRGLSGPAILQASSYWTDGAPLWIDLLPDTDLAVDLKAQKKSYGRKALTTALARHLPQRLVDHLASELALTGNVADQPDAGLDDLAAALAAWKVTPTATEGYRTAEVTLGGINTDGISSKTLQSKTVPGLYMIGEAVDVTGWLGGYNFQWAWSSGWAAGQAIAQTAA